MNIYQLLFRTKECQCWGKCPKDQTCKDRYNGGVCSIESPGAGFKATSYRCLKGFANKIIELLNTFLNIQGTKLHLLGESRLRSM